MAARSTWSGAIRLGPLTVPISVYKAVDEYEGDTSLRELCECHGKPFTQTSICSGGNRRVSKERVPGQGETHMVKGVELGAGKYAVLDSDALSGINEAVNSKVIEVDRIVPYEAVPMEFTTRTYYVRHDKKAALAEETLATVHAVLSEEGKAIVGTWAHHGNERIVAIHTVGDLTVMTELLYNQEIRDDSDYAIEHEADPQEVAVAKQLLAAFEQDEFDHAHFENRAVAMRAEAIKAAVKGKTPAKRDADATKAAAPSSLLEALKASLEEVEAPAKAKGKKKATNK